MRFTSRYLNTQKESKYILIELGARTGYSVLDGVGSPSDLVKQASSLNIDVLAICDYYSTAGYDEFSRSCYSNEIDAIYGVTLNVDNNKVIVLAKNKNGVIAINTLISRAFLDKNTHPNEPLHNTFLEIAEFSKDIITIAIPEKEKEIPDLLNQYDYIGLTPNQNFGFLKMGIHYTRYVFLSDSSYISKSDKFLYDVLQFNCSDDFHHLRNNQKQVQDSNYWALIDNPLSLIKNIEDDAYEGFSPTYSCPDLITPERFKAVVLNEINKRNEFKRSQYNERLSKELNSVIESKHFNEFFIVHKLVKHLKEKGYHVLSKGVASSSLLSYALGISDIDPIKWDLPFYSFLGFEAKKEPVFNLAIPEDAEKDIYSYLKKLVGKENILRAADIVKFEAEEITEKANAYLKRHDEYYEDFEDVKIFKLLNTVKSVGVDRSKYFFKNDNDSFYKYTPVKIINNEPVAYANYYSLVSSLFRIEAAPTEELTLLETLEKSTGIKIDEVPLDDPQVLSLYLSDKVITRGKQISNIINPFECIFDLGTPFAHELIYKIKPKTIDDYIKLIGFTHGTNVWKTNAEELLERGYQLNEVFANREDIFDLLVYKYGLEEYTAFHFMENVRKGRGLKSNDLELLKNHNVPENLINSMLKIKYAFPRSAAIYFATIALKEAYYKVHFTKEFYEAYFNCKFDKELLKKVSVLSIQEKYNLLEDKKTSKEMIKLLCNYFEMMFRHYDLILNSDEFIEIVDISSEK